LIGFLRGILLAKAPPQLLLDVHGVGYEIEAPMTTFYDLPPTGQEVSLHTHLVVREDAQILFGFGSETDRALFRLLIRVNGVGPKMALTILSGLTAGEFNHCIANSDAPALVRLPGVGKKTAERLIIEMRDRLPGLEVHAGTGEGVKGTVQLPHDPRQEAISALVALGYKAQDAGRMVQNSAVEGGSCEEIIRAALQGAGRK